MFYGYCSVVYLVLLLGKAGLLQSDWLTIFVILFSHWSTSVETENCVWHFSTTIRISDRIWISSIYQDESLVLKCPPARILLLGVVWAEEGDEAADRGEEEGGELRDEEQEGGQVVNALQRNSAPGWIWVWLQLWERRTSVIHTWLGTGINNTSLVMSTSDGCRWSRAGTRDCSGCVLERRGSWWYLLSWGMETVEQVPRYLEEQSWCSRWSWSTLTGRVNCETMINDLPFIIITRESQVCFVSAVSHHLAIINNQSKNPKSWPGGNSSTGLPDTNNLDNNDKD